MDSECMSLLPGVCEVMADSGRALLDDTSLEKLLDWFTGLTQAGGSLLKACPCLLEFISAVVSNASSDPGVPSFTLKLTGLLAASEDGFKTLQEASVLRVVFSIRHWREAGLWEDPCLRIGWIQGLKNLLQHPEALSFFVKSEFIKPLLQLQTDPSLFVASATNQTLAHILLFFQPVSPAGCNGVDDKDNGRAPTSVYSDVVVAISEHLKRCLVPGANAASVQTLELLALLLARSSPPLRDALLQAVADALEQLATAGCSRLTLPLVDVVLAARSCGADERFPDRRFDRLLSSMLNADDPSDLIHAAAACLRSGLRNPPHASQAVRILLLPLELASGQVLLEADDDDDARRRRLSITEHLRRKASCIATVCVCLTNLQQITLMPADFLPCAPGLTVGAVLSLLKVCSGVPSSAGEAGRNVIGSVKVQKRALEALTALTALGGGADDNGDVFAVLLRYLDNPDSDPAVLHKSYQAFIKWTAVLTDSSSITEQLRADLVGVVRKRVCDARWEVRDSTVEFLGQLADVRVPPNAAEEACGSPEALLGGFCTAPLIGEALQDVESYVRASAVSAMVRTLERGWQQGAALSQRETETARRLLDILSQDPEGFSRRAVVRYFTAWFSSCSSSSRPPLLTECVQIVLRQGSADADWEVKVHALELAELLLDDAFPGHAGSSEPRRTAPHPYGVTSDLARTPHAHAGAPVGGGEPGVARAMNRLVERGVFSALLSGLVDCDRPVGLKACRLLIRLRDAVCPLLPGQPDASKVTCKLPAGGWGQEIRRTLGTKRSFGAEDSDGVPAGVPELLTSLDLDERLDVLTRSSDHVHNSPLSLLQDILSTRVAHTRPGTDAGQEVIVDCY
ncbi:BRCA1-associated ATM activator 1 [Brachionichthys hirsutus]|uniref:BRCA1-associated ATM activator 1 n=1 Tax=Brachionichthys hirsutus TaxID=412623 RepID=UPI0036044E7B